MACRVPPGAPNQLAFERVDLIINGMPRRQQGLDHQAQLGMLGDARADLGREPSTPALRQDQTENLHQAANLIDHLGPHADRCLRTPKVARTRWLSTLFAATSRYHPVRTIWARPSASLVSLLLICTDKAARA